MMVTYKESEIKQLAGTDDVLNKSVMLLEIVGELAEDDIEVLAILHNVIGVVYKVLEDNGVKIIQDLE